VTKRVLPLGKPYFDDCELRRIEAVLKSGCWAGTCQEVKNFEDQFAHYVGTTYSVACSSCTTALHAALLSVGVKRGDEVMVAAFTHPATGFAVAYCQAKPVLIDVDLDTYTISVEHARKNITSKTKAIIPVYAFGLPPDVGAILEFSEKYDIRVVWDAATGLGAEYKGRNAGSFSDCECFSFYPTKNIATGEGGMITTDNEEIAEKARSVVDFGVTKQTKKFDRLGYNYRLSSIQAAIGICQLEKLPQFFKAKRELAVYYKRRLAEEISSLYWIRPQIEPVEMKSAWQRFVCIVHHKDKPNLRNKLMEYLQNNGIGCTIGTFSLASQPFFRNEKCCPNANFLYNNTIALPLYYGMKEEDVDYVIEKLQIFWRL